MRYKYSCLIFYMINYVFLFKILIYTYIYIHIIIYILQEFGPNQIGSSSNSLALLCALAIVVRP